MPTASGKAQGTDRESRPATAARPMRELFFFYLPLALTHLMMSGGTPIINAGIARLPEPVEGLAAFAVAFAFSVFLSSLCFGLEPAVIALVRGPRSFSRVLRFSLVLGFSISALKLMIGLSPLADLVFEDFFGLEAELAARAARTFCIFSPIPFLLAFRSVGRGVLTSVSRTPLIGWGTLLRLLTMIAVVVAGVFTGFVPGPILGILALLAAILVEAVFIGLAALRQVGRLPGDEEGGAGLSYASIFSFVSPLLISGLFGVSVFSIVNAVVSRTADADMAVSAFSVVRSIVWFIISMLMSFQQLIIAKSATKEERRHVLSFVACVTVVITLFVAVLAYTPLGCWVMRVVIGVRGETLRAAEDTLLVMPLLPLVIGARSYLRGAAIRDRRPGHVLPSSIIAMLAACLVGVLCIDAFAVGAMVAAVMWITAHLAEMTTLLLLRLGAAGTGFVEKEEGL